MAKVIGLQMAAADNLTKLFSVAEAVARINGICRGVNALSEQACDVMQSPRFGDVLAIDPGTREGRVQGRAKIERDPAQPKQPHTVWWVAYKVAIEDARI